MQAILVGSDLVAIRVEFLVFVGGRRCLKLTERYGTNDSLGATTSEGSLEGAGPAVNSDSALFSQL